MSLESASGDFLAALSSLIDGCDVINLIKCGNKRLIHTLHSTPLVLEFCVCHVGFLAFDDVLVSLSRYLPSTIESAFIAPLHGESGLTAILDVPAVKVEKLKGVSLPHLRKFAVVGCETFVVKSVLKCLKEMVNINGPHSIDELFPKVHTWMIGDFLHLYHRSWLALNDKHEGQCTTWCDALACPIPQSVTSLSLKSLDRSESEQYDLFMTQHLKTLPSHEHGMMRRLDTPNFCMTNALLKLPQLQQLSILFTQWGDDTLSMADLPRTLTWFGVNNGLSQRKCQRVTLIDAPPHLTNITIDHSSLLVIKEALPLKLKTLEFCNAEDPTFILSATTLPSSLTLLKGRYVISGDDSAVLDWDDHVETNLIDMDVHLFRKIDRSSNATTWPIHWPPKLKVPIMIDRDTVLYDNLIFRYMTTMKHLPQCAYTLTHSNRPTTATGESNQLMLDESIPCDGSDNHLLSTAMHSTTDGMIDSYMLDIINQASSMNSLTQVSQSDVKLCILWMNRYDYKLPISQTYLPILFRLLSVEDDFGRPINPHLMAISVYTDVDSSRYQKEQQFVLDHIDQILPNASKLQCYDRSKLSKLPKWVKSLQYTHSSGSSHDDSSLDASIESEGEVNDTHQAATVESPTPDLTLCREEDKNAEDTSFWRYTQSLLQRFAMESIQIMDSSVVKKNCDDFTDVEYKDEPLGGDNLIPPLLRQLSFGLTSLELIVTETFMNQLAAEFTSFVASLPRSLLYFSVYSFQGARTHRKLDLSGVVTVLPPNLRRLHCPTFKLKGGIGDLNRLCRDVCDVPSLRLLVVTFESETSSKSEFKVASHHCVSVVKTSLYHLWQTIESIDAEDANVSEI